MWNMRSLRVALTVMLGFSLTGCATDIMRGYIGRTPQDVMARYGPPDNVFDMPDGRRAYQWLEVSESTSPGSEQTRTRWVEKRDGRRERVTTTEISPPVSERKKCYYTMYAHRDRGDWIFDSFQQPEFGC
jgi:hypothetical protein